MPAAVASKRRARVLPESARTGPGRCAVAAASRRTGCTVRRWATIGCSCRRLVLVLTDGRPDDREGAQHVLALCQDAGIETIGVGIAIDVGALFPTAVTVHALGELRQALFRLAERLRLGVAA